MYICFYNITDFVFLFELVPCKSCRFNNFLTEAGVVRGAGCVDYLEHLVPLLKSDIGILSILHYLGSPLGFCTLIFDLMRNLYIYNACIYIHSIISSLNVFLCTTHCIRFPCHHDTDLDFFNVKIDNLYQILVLDLYSRMLLFIQLLSVKVSPIDGAVFPYYICQLRQI